MDNASSQYWFEIALAYEQDGDHYSAETALQYAIHDLDNPHKAPAHTVP